MEDLRAEISRAIGRGAWLSLCAVSAGCGGQSEGDDGGSTRAGRAGAPAVGGSAGAGGASAAGGTSASGGSGGGGVPGLVPYPLDQLGCFGEDYGDGPGFYGQCCASAICVELVDGACPTADSQRPPGSGECTCSATPLGDEGPRGPYAPNPAHTPEGSGPCCYVVAAVGCDGRPLVVAGRSRVAAVVRRADWAARRA